MGDGGERGRSAIQGQMCEPRRAVESRNGVLRTQCSGRGVAADGFTKRVGSDDKKALFECPLESLALVSWQ